MLTRVRNDTRCQEKDLDKELSEVLISISAVSRRIADRLNACGSEKKGENVHERRIVYTRR